MTIRPTPDRFLTVAQVARRLQVSERTIKRKIEAGELAGIKVGHQWRISPGDLETFLRQNRRGGDRVVL